MHGSAVRRCVSSDFGVKYELGIFWTGFVTFQFQFVDLFL